MMTSSIHRLAKMGNTITYFTDKIVDNTSTVEACKKPPNTPQDEEYKSYEQHISYEFKYTSEECGRNVDLTTLTKQSDAVYGFNSNPEDKSRLRSKLSTSEKSRIITKAKYEEFLQDPKPL